MLAHLISFVGLYLQPSEDGILVLGKGGNEWVSLLQPPVHHQGYAHC